MLACALNLCVSFLWAAGVTGFYFAFCVVIDGVQYKTGMGITKKEARAKAAELAIEELMTGSKDAGIPSDVSGKNLMMIHNINTHSALTKLSLRNFHYFLILLSF